MEQYLKITAGLLLFVQAFHLASFQDTTNSPGRTINPSWLRDLTKNAAGSENEDGQTDDYETIDTTAMESSNDYSGGITSGFTSDERAANAAPEDAALPHTFLNSSTEQPETTDSSASTTADLTNSSKVNMTDAEDKSHNSTIIEQSEHTTTSSPDSYNHTQLQSTTLAPDSNTTQDSTANPEEDGGLTNGIGFSNTTTANPEEDGGLTNSTEFNNTTTANPEEDGGLTNSTEFNNTTTANPEEDGGLTNSTGFSNTTTANTTPEINETSTTSSSTTPFPSVTSGMSPATTTSTAAATTEKVNGTNKDFPFGNGSDRDLQSDLHQHKRQVAWGAVLGAAVAVACVGLVAYIILKNRHNKGFSHRKLVEDHPSDPVHRLDNNEPLDLNFGGLAYYNPGLQGDNIQMTHFPGRR
ncbi:mucin-15 [Mastacembelus armatus]|uniref:Mucin 15, cell surface associated n=1 Tax=Mastacembelus armatus TaxID=205130 RepID=A0A3Q3M5A3_9TELE|nr:mucin-15 [Mastacembelus armatus]XP_026175916.1 mucin-15 [Mastacembelus armatus]